MKFIHTLLFSIIIGNVVAQTPNATVAQDGTGNYTTVAAAIAAAPSSTTTPWVIFIKNGRYREKINCNKQFIQLIGESVANTILYYDDPATVLGTQNSYSFQVSAADFSAFNITFANTFGDGSQAVAMLVNADRAAFKNCRFLGNQDTLYTKGSGQPRHYFKDCYIDGNVDFIFGSSIALFENCYVYAKARPATTSSFITAANTTTGQPYGYVFKDCKLPANTGGTVYFLGRPWNNDAGGVNAFNRTVFMESFYGAGLIQPAGWSTWDAGTNTSNLLYAEYQNKNFDGSLANIASRASWSTQLDATQASAYTIANMFGTWNPCTVYAGFCNTNPADIAVANFRTAKVGSNSNFNWNISWPKIGITYEVFRSTNGGASYSVVNTQTATDTTNINFNYSEAVPPPSQSYKYYVRASLAGFASHNTDTLTVSSIPTITNAGILGGFVQSLGTPSTPQTYTVSGVNLTDNIIITAPANFEISSNNGVTWNNSATPIVLTPSSGSVATTNISVRLNATSVGANSGSIIHTSTGATNVNVALTGNTQLAALNPITVLQYWPMTVNNNDDATTRSVGVTASIPTFSTNMVMSDGNTTVAGYAIAPYSVLHGQAFAPAVNGLWNGTGGPGGSLSRNHYQQFTVTASSTHSVHIDSIIMKNSVYNSANGRLAISYSTNGFTSFTDVTGATLSNTLGVYYTLANETTTGTNSLIRLAFNGSTGINLNAGQVLTIRLYYAVGSGSTGRYAKIKDLQIKGYTTLNPVDGEYQTRQSGNWDDVNTWERHNGTAWVYPAPTYPVYNNAVTTTILAGHTVTMATTPANGSGYVDRVIIKQGGQVIVAAGATMNIANDGTPSTATTDLQIDGALSVNGAIATNGNVATVINGTFINSSPGSWNMSNTGDTVTINNDGTYQHNINSGTTPANLVCKPNSNFKVTGITSNQTGIFKSAINYGNIEWDCPNQGGYYAFRANLHSNIQGKVTVTNTGPTYISFHNASVKTVIPGGFYQTGGRVNFREGGTVVDTLVVGGDFSVTSTGVFNSNVPTGSTFALVLNGINKSLKYGGNTLNNTNVVVNGIYNLDSTLIAPTTAFGPIVNGTLNMASNVSSGSGSFTINNTGTVTSAQANGLDGSIAVSGTKTFNSANYVFNGTTAQTTGASLPASVNSIVINNTAGVTLSNSTTLAGPLTLTNGKLSVGNNTITTPTILGASAAKYIVTDGTGALKITNVGTATTLFPVGATTTNYTPTTITNNGTVDDFSVNVANANAPCITNTANAVPITWNINEGTVGGTVATISLDYGTTIAGASFNAATAVVAHCAAAAPTTIDYSGGTVTGTVVTIGGATSFSPFGITSDVVVLPLQLVSFTGNVVNKKAQLQWRTTNEVNVAKFEVQKSDDGINFITIATQSAANGIQNLYTFNDNNYLLNKTFYRIVIVDVNGIIKYSNIVALRNNISIIVGPNPAKNHLNISLPFGNTKSQIILTNAQGQQIRNIFTTNTENYVNLHSINTGIYILTIWNNNKKYTQKITIN